MTLALYNFLCLYIHVALARLQPFYLPSYNYSTSTSLYILRELKTTPTIRTLPNFDRMSVLKRRFNPEQTSDEIFNPESMYTISTYLTLLVY